MTIEAYPLTWPAGRPRTPDHLRSRSKFETTMARARDEVIRQIELMTGKYTHNKREADLIISTNVKLRQDGLPAAQQIRNIDSGVAVYFNYKKKPMCFACDRWAKVEDNMWAIAKTIDALRGIARWGTGDMMEAAFTGFTALPSRQPWRYVLNCHGCTSLLEAESAYRAARKIAHPDHGGTSEAFNAVQKAWEEAQAELS